MNNKYLRDLLNNSDDNSIERLTEGKKVMTDAEKERIFAMSRYKLDEMKKHNYNGFSGDVVKGVENYRKSIAVKFAGMAAAAVVLCAGIGGVAYIASNMNHVAPDNNNIPPAATSFTTSVTDVPATTSFSSTVTGSNPSAAADSLTTAAASAAAAEKDSTPAVSAAQTNPADPADNNSAAEPVTQAQNNTAQTEDPFVSAVLNEIGAVSVFDENTAVVYREYAEIIRECGTMISNRSNSGLKYGDALSNEFIVNADSPYGTSGYAFMDVNGDGVMELLLGLNSFDNNDASFKSVVFNIFSVDDSGNVCMTDSGSSYSRIYICSDNSDTGSPRMNRNSIVAHETLGAWQSYFYRFARINYGRLDPVESITVNGYDESGSKMYHTYDFGSGEPQEKDRVSHEEGMRIINSYPHLDIQFKPFS